MLNVFIGWDSRETVCSHVAAHSITKRTNSPADIKFLKHREQRQAGNFARPWLIEATTGQYRDMIDDKPFSTEFSHTRFLIPKLMNYKGWALFMDADMIFLSDIKKLFDMRDDKFAVMCVKHTHIPNENKPKMDGIAQSRYHRKNWSSFVLWNCAHPANQSLTSERVNFFPGKELHAFSWLSDAQIGALPFSYNYISGVSPKFSLPAHNRPDVIHFTEGGPWFDECKEVPYGKFWIEEYEDWQSNGNGNKVTAAPPAMAHGDKIRMQSND